MAIIKTILYTADWSSYGQLVTFEKDDSGDYPVLHMKPSNDRITYTLTFTNGLSFCKSILVEFFLSVDPLIKKTCILLQKVVLECGLGAYFSVYIIALLVINYYQKQDLLPSVSSLQEMVDNVIQIGPWQVNFEPCLPKAMNKKWSKILPQVHAKYINDFFEYMGNKIGLPSAKLISPFLGNLSLKPGRIEENFVKNPSLKRYHEFCAKAPTNEHLQMDTAICLQDPIELNKNITAHIPPAVVEYFRLTLAHAAKSMNF